MTTNNTLVAELANHAATAAQEAEAEKAAAAEKADADRAQHMRAIEQNTLLNNAVKDKVTGRFAELAGHTITSRSTLTLNVSDVSLGQRNAKVFVASETPHNEWGLPDRCRIAYFDGKLTVSGEDGTEVCIIDVRVRLFTPEALHCAGGGGIIYNLGSFYVDIKFTFNRVVKKRLFKAEHVEQVSIYNTEDLIAVLSA